MFSSPTNRLKTTASSSPFNSPLQNRPLTRSPMRRSTAVPEARLTLKRVVGTTCSAPTGFDTVACSFAYVAGGAAVVVDVDKSGYSQRFYRARPTAVPTFPLTPLNSTSPSPHSTPKANDSRNRMASVTRESQYAYANDWSAADPPKTWTSRERIKAATCLSLSRDGRFLAVGETGYAPRVLTFNLRDSSSDTPLVSISEHTFGVKAVAWSPDGRFLASLGAANDGFLYIWRIDARTGAAKLFQQNRCTANVRGMTWLGSSLVTFGSRHVKMWRVVETLAMSPTKQKFLQDSQCGSPQAQKTLPGRNILLGSLLDAVFNCAAVIDDSVAVICSESGDVCVLDDTNNQMKLTRLMGLDFAVSCAAVRNSNIYIAGKTGQFVMLPVAQVLAGLPVLPPQPDSDDTCPGLLAMGFLTDKFVTVDVQHTISIVDHHHLQGRSRTSSTNSCESISTGENMVTGSSNPIQGHQEPILGVQSISGVSEYEDAMFFTWSGTGTVTLWDLEGHVKCSFVVPLEQLCAEPDPEVIINQLTIVRATRHGKQFVVGDKLGVIKVIDFASKACVHEIKAHSSDCQSMSIFEGTDKCLLATSGRDRTAQLFRRSKDGYAFEHFQTLEFAARVTQVLIPAADKLLTCSLDRTLQVHELVTKEGDPDMMAALCLRVIPLKASPSSMAMTLDDDFVFVSLLDRSVARCCISKGKVTGSFKCTDESGSESVLLDSLVVGPLAAAASVEGGDAPSLLLAMSNTDKSVRLYDAQTGSFVDREWGHTESIGGVALIDMAAAPDNSSTTSSNEEDKLCRFSVVSVGADGTMMIWKIAGPETDGVLLGAGGGNMVEALSRRDTTATAAAAALAAATATSTTTALTADASARQPLRRVLSRAELAEFQRSCAVTSTPLYRKSPPPSQPRSLRSRKSRPAFGSSTFRSPVPASPVGTNGSEEVTRKTSGGAGGAGGTTPLEHNLGSPPVSPRAKVIRRPSLANLSLNVSNGSSTSTVGGGSTMGGRGGYAFGSVNMATEQTCRALRAYRKKLASTEPIRSELLLELDQELRLTVATLGDRALRSTAVNETVLSSLLDQYSERLVSLLDEKLCLARGEAAGGETSGDGRISGGSGCGAGQGAEGSEGGGRACGHRRAPVRSSIAAGSGKRALPVTGLTSNGGLGTSESLGGVATSISTSVSSATTAPIGPCTPAGSIRGNHFRIAVDEDEEVLADLDGCEDDGDDGCGVDDHADGEKNRILLRVPERLHNTGRDSGNGGPSRALAGRGTTHRSNSTDDATSSKRSSNGSGSSPIKRSSSFEARRGLRSAAVAMLF